MSTAQVRLRRTTSSNQSTQLRSTFFPGRSARTDSPVSGFFGSNAGVSPVQPANDANDVADVQRDEDDRLQPLDVDSSGLSDAQDAQGAMDPAGEESASPGGKDAAVQTLSVNAHSSATAAVTTPSPPSIAAAIPVPDLGEQASRAEADHRRELAQATHLEQAAGIRDTAEQRNEAQRANAVTLQGTAQEATQDSEGSDDDEMTLPRLADLMTPLPEQALDPVAQPADPSVVAGFAFPFEDGTALEPDQDMNGSMGAVPAAADFITAAVKRLNTESTETQARVAGSADDARQRVRVSARSMRARVRGQVQRSVAGLRERFSAQRSHITSAIQSARGQMQQQYAVRLIEAEALRLKTRTDTSGIFSDHRTKIQRVVSDNVDAATALNTRYSGQARTTNTEKRNTVRRRGSDQVARYPNTLRGVVQQNAARGVANRVGDEMRDQLPDTLAAIDEVTAPIPQEFREKGQQALDGFDDGLPKLLEGIDDQVEALSRTLYEQAQRAEQQFDQMQRQWLEQLERAENAAVSRAQGFEPQAIAQINRGRRVALRHIDLATESTSTPITGVVAEAVAMLQMMNDADPQATAAFVELVLQWVNGMADEASDAMGQAATGVAQELGRATPLTAQGLRRISRQVDQQLAADQTTVSGSLMGFVTSVDDGFGVTISRISESFSGTMTEIRSRLVPAVTDLERDFTTSLRDAETRIRMAVNDGLGKHDDALRLLGGDMREAAAKAAWDHDHPVLSTLRDIGAIILGVIVGILAIIAVIVVVIIAIKAAAFLLAAAGLSAAVAALVAKIIVIGGLLAYAGYSAYQAYNAYRATGQGGAEAALTVLQDFTGISDLRRSFGDDSLSYYERGKAFGRGATTLVLSFLGGRALIARFRGRVPSSVPNPRLPANAGRLARGRHAARIAVPLPRVRLPSFRRTPPGRPPIGFGNEPLPRSHPSRVAVEGPPPPPGRPIGFGTQPLPRSHPARVAVEGPPPPPRRPIGFGSQPQPRSPSTPPPLPRRPIGFGTRPQPRSHPMRVAVEGPPQSPGRPIGYGSEPLPRTHPSRVLVEGPPPPARRPIGFGSEPLPRSHLSRVAVEGRPPPEPRIGFGRNPGAARPSSQVSSSGPRAVDTLARPANEPFFAPRPPTASGSQSGVATGGVRSTPPSGRAPARTVASAGDPPGGGLPRRAGQSQTTQTAAVERPTVRTPTPEEAASTTGPTTAAKPRAWVQMDDGAIVEIVTTADEAVGARVTVDGKPGRIVVIDTGPPGPGERLPGLGDLAPETVAPRPAVAPRTAPRVPKVKRPRLSGKEAASDVPGWAKGERPFVGENGRAFARRILNEKYGEGNWGTGPTSEFNQIRKWGDRAFQDPT